jgi:L-ascorbate metabolism protein UlaG (beta-lactamase superfamily)
MKYFFIIASLIIILWLTVYFYLSTVIYYRGPVSNHFDGKRFFNPYDDNERSFKKFIEWQIGRKPEPWPEHMDNTFSDVPPKRYEGGGGRVSFVGHATALIQIEGVNILIDPMWSERASPLNFTGPKRINAPGIKFENLPKIDLVLISHNHYDHLDIESIKLLRKHHDPLFIVPLGNDTIIKYHDTFAKTVSLDWFGKHEVNGIKVHATPAVHWSSRFVIDRNKALWAGFIIETNSGNIYYSGDTALGSGKIFDIIYEKYGKPILAILPIGTYEERDFMKSVHINPDDAMVIRQRLGSPKTLGVHYGTFRLSDENPDHQIKDFELACKKYGVSGHEDFRLLKVGEFWEVKP